MAFVSFRQVFPKGFYARSVLLTLLPLTVMLTLMSIYYFNGHLRTVNAKLSQSLAREILLIDETCRRDPMNISVQLVIEATLNARFVCAYEAPADENIGDQRFFYAGLVRDQIDQVTGRTSELFLTADSRRLDIRVPGDDRVLRVIVDRKRAININGHIFIVWVVSLALVTAFAALAFLRNHVRSILRLTEAADAFGRGKTVADFRPGGAREVRAAARAVIEMRERLTGFAQERTAMLAGVSHDLRTPLARLQLQLAMQEQTEDVKDARSDIRDMEAMLDEYLAFARGEDDGKVQDVNISAVIRETVNLFPAARFVGGDAKDIVLSGKRLALKRALTNVVANGVAYGDRVEVRLDQLADRISILVGDDGPGIPPEKYEDVLKPFARLNEARTQNVPGVGLGLALARDTARSHGGQLSLQASSLGGLQVEMQLPL